MPEWEGEEPMLETEHYQDEISLRDLYLILRRGLPLILGTALVVGVLVFIVSTFLPKVYEAETTTLVTPPPVQIQAAQNLTFRPPNEVSFEAYETLAESLAVKEAATATLPAVDARGGWKGSVEVLIGPQRPDQIVPLAVTHRVRHRDPVLAAQLADAWALSTVKALQGSLLASLAPIREATQAEILTRRNELETLESTYERFQAEDDGETLDILLANLALRISEGEELRDDLRRRQAAALAQIAILDETSALSGSPVELAEALNLIQSFDADEPEVRVEQQTTSATDDENAIQITLTPEPTQELLEQLEALLRVDGQAPPSDVVALLNRADLYRFAINAAGYIAEMAQLDSQLADYETQTVALQTRIARLDAERARLERDLANAEQAFSSVAALEPVINYVTEITPTNARLLNEASVPSSPAAPRRLLNTALAVVVAGVLSLLFVFLREAVRAPGPVPA